MIYRSSAGSGKTFALVKEYLKLALGNMSANTLYFKSILAVTFTNKAAGEMKERVLRALKELSLNKLSGGTATLQGLLLEELKIDAPELQKRAALLLHEILHNYSDFSISTIDSFVHRVIRTFAFDLKLPVNFNIETDEQSILSKCIDALISTIGVEEQLTNVLMEFSKSRALDNKSWQVDNDIKQFVQNVVDENNKIQLDKLRKLSIDDFIGIKEKLRTFISSFEKEISAYAEKAFELIRQRSLSPEHFYRGSSGIFSYFKKILNGEYDDESLLKTYVLQTINEDKWYAGKNSASENSAIDAVSTELKNLFLQIENLRKEKVQQYFVYSSVFKNIYALTVVNEVEKLVNQFKEEQNILFISEFNNRISEVILKEPVPFIYERIGERYKHFLIDEFQDTSIVQWHNLLPLIDNSLAEGKFNMIVGDGKQSIYRWRGGEVEQFASLPNVKDHFGNEFTTQRERSLVNHHQFKNLDSNYRSKAGVIRFNNDFFRFLSGAELSESWKNIYEGLEQKYNPANEGGYVSIDFEDAEDDKKNDVVLEKMLEYIRMNLEKGYSYRDIAILVRTNGIGNRAADFLTERNIPIVSSESLLLEKSAEVNFLLNCLRVISNTSDLLSASGMIAYLCAGNFIPAEKEHQLLERLNSWQEPVNIQQLLEENGLAFPLPALLALPLFDCCVQLSTTFNLDKVNPVYVQFFLDEVISFTRTNSNNIHAFFEWWENRRGAASVILPSGTNAVSIMTIHASKGLEFPVVIIPYCDWITQKTDFIWVDLEEKNLEELPATLVKSSKDLKQTAYSGYAEKENEKQLLDNLNLLYVGLTRPVNHLHLISRIPKHHFPSTYKWLVSYLTYKNEYEKDVIHYEFGEWVNKPAEKNMEEGHFLSPVQLHYWKDIIQVKQVSSNIWSHEASEEKKDRGILLHYILSKIKSAADIPAAVDAAVLEGYLAEAEKTEIRNVLEALLTDASIAPFFKPGLEIKNEAELLLENGQTLRPDRIVIEKDTVYVIDYKTGKALEKYHQQLDSYAQALHRLGYKNVKKLLVYINELKTEEVL